MKSAQRFFLFYALIIFGMASLIVFVQFNMPSITEAPSLIPKTNTQITSTETLQYTAITIEDTTCYFQKLIGEITIPKGTNVRLIGRDSLGEWVLIDQKEPCRAQEENLKLSSDILLLPIVFRPFMATVNQIAFCYNGPQETYIGAIFISENTIVELLAVSDESNWYMIRQPNQNTGPCWMEASKLTIKTSVDGILVFTTVLTIDNAPCYLQPNIEAILQTIIPTNQRVVVYGKSDNEGSWILVVPHDSTRYCWVEKTVLDEFLSENVPIESFDIALPVQSTSISPLFLTPTRSGGNLTTLTSTAIQPPTNTPGGPPATNTPVPPQPTNTPVPPPTGTLPPPPLTNTPSAPTNPPSGSRECNDGIDNDGDGFIDFPADSGCKNNGDDSE